MSDFATASPSLTRLRSTYGDEPSALAASARPSDERGQEPSCSDGRDVAPRVHHVSLDLPSDGSLPTSPTLHLQKAFKKAMAVTVMMRKYTMPFGDLNMTTLMHACATGNLPRMSERIDELVSMGNESLEEELLVVDDWAGSTPLHWAAYSGNARIVELLLRHGARVDARNARDGSMPIHLAARYVHVLRTCVHACTYVCTCM